MSDPFTVIARAIADQWDDLPEEVAMEEAIVIVARLRDAGLLVSVEETP